MAFTRILVPLDGSELAGEAIGHAVQLARSSNARICLLHVLQHQQAAEEDPVDTVDWKLRRAEAESYLHSIAGDLSANGLEASYHLEEGRPAEQILGFAHTHDINLIVFSAYGKGGITRFQFGSTVQKVIAGSNVSFLIVRPEAHQPGMEAAYQRILIPLDGSHSAEWAACRTAAMLRDQKAELVLLQVIPIPEMQRRIPMTHEERMLRDKFVECNRRAAQAYLRDVATQLGNGVSVRTRLVVAQSVVRHILDIAEEEQVNLIAMSAHGYSDGSHRAMGSSCQAIISQSTRPVLVFNNLPDSQPQLQQDASLGRKSALMSQGA